MGHGRSRAIYFFCRPILRSSGSTFHRGVNISTPRRPRDSQRITQPDNGLPRGLSRERTRSGTGRRTSSAELALRFVWADHKVMDKLRMIQQQLRIALIPYELWTTRVSSELSGDFEQVAIYTQARRPDWVTFLEATFQVLHTHHALGQSLGYNPRLRPSKGLRHPPYLSREGEDSS
ncbi:hypothetical protein GGR54DRAFT_314300 [Hypoxylon sp. NC1633]|nr:hypothetical protein GGR54DRAFT_314300 [Hypoxylon sp. NC1633]